MVILVIDNSSLIIDRIIELLVENTRKIELFRANTCQEATKLLEHMLPDIVLLDIFLPNNRSMDLLKKIKSVCADTKVIMLTLKIDALNDKRYLDAGADCILDKYHEFEKIPAAIDALVFEKKLQILKNHALPAQP